jgi:ABC-type multidrug transport system ATPase subunit
VGRTTIVIAHRLSTVQRAHQILVMERGAVTARGTHDELLRTSPLYRHLYEIQFELQRDEALSPDGAPGADGAAADGVKTPLGRPVTAEVAR